MKQRCNVHYKILSGWWVHVLSSWPLLHCVPLVHFFPWFLHAFWTCFTGLPTNSMNSSITVIQDRLYCLHKNLTDTTLCAEIKPECIVFLTWWILVDSVASLDLGAPSIWKACFWHIFLLTRITFFNISAVQSQQRNFFSLPYIKQHPRHAALTCCLSFIPIFTASRSFNPRCQFIIICTLSGMWTAYRFWDSAGDVYLL